MKRLSFLFVIALICSVMVSCNKEGQFNPKKKISQISYANSYKSEYWDEYSLEWETEQGSSNYVGQRWNWNGNLLESIDFYESDGTLDYTEYYTYDGKQISSVNYGGSGRYDFVYEKNKLSAIDYYVGSTHYYHYELTHDGKKISKMTLTVLNDSKAEMPSFPSFLLNIPTKQLQKASKGVECEWRFEWDGDNLKHITYLEPGDSYDLYYTYDNKLNPMCGLWDMESGGIAAFMSKNNIVREEYRWDGETEVYNISYTYQGNYPATATTSYNYNSDDYRYTSTTTTYFDYK